MISRKIGLINYGAGNFTSVFNAFKFLEIEAIEINVPDQFNEVSHIVLPGVGAFAAAVRKLEALKLLDAIKEHILIQKKFFLGICVGMQILADVGLEFEKYAGLGVISGKVDKINTSNGGLKLPHIGWNEVHVTDKACYLFNDMPERPIFYFVHSYCFRPQHLDKILATCNYGEEITAAIGENNIFGVQFHPEKSQHNGLQLLNNFASLKN